MQSHNDRGVSALIVLYNTKFSRDLRILAMHEAKSVNTQSISRFHPGRLCGNSVSNAFCDQALGYI